MVRGEFDGSFQGVDEPTQYDLASTPAHVNFVLLLSRDPFTLYLWIVLPVIGMEDLTVYVEHLAAELVESGSRTLGD